MNNELDVCFERWLSKELKKPNAHYDPNGGSARAKVSRGVLGEIVYQYIDFPKRVVSAIRTFDGLSTPVSWFVEIPVAIILIPVLPIVGGCFSYYSALSEYRDSYRKYKADSLHK